jgi:hypothetical protein
MKILRSLIEMYEYLQPVFNGNKSWDYLKFRNENLRR